MITIKADNRQLLQNAKYSYLSDNYASGVQSFIFVSSIGFAVNDYILIGEFGQETSEILLVDGVTASTHTVTTSATSAFAHSQDVKVTILKYNQVKFYRTATSTFSESGNELTGEGSPADIQADQYFTLLYDTTNTTGFGWFKFYNETTAVATDESNAIPYADFNEFSVTKIFDSFFSLLNNKEKKMIDNADAFRWLNEAYSIAQNELNLVNPEYTVPAEVTVTTVSGTQEYSLETDFSDLVSVTNQFGDELDYISLKDVPKRDFQAGYSETNVQYYLRADKIGLSPIPTGADNYSIWYRPVSATLTSYFDDITLPDKNYFPLVDFMMYKASIKLEKPNPVAFFDMFTTGVNRMKITSNKQNANDDRWGISNEANV